MRSVTQVLMVITLRLQVYGGGVNIVIIVALLSRRGCAGMAHIPVRLLLFDFFPQNSVVFDAGFLCLWLDIFFGYLM